jgi:light-regulated signal transduction histidine kinase (bacteriophytochrome)
LEFSKAGKSEDKMEDVNLDELLQELQILYGTEIAEKKAIIHIDPLPVLHTAKAPLRQVFHNLVGNSLRYQAGGAVPQIHVSVKEKEKHWEFAIKDNGIGIDAKYHDKIFIIFQRLHNREIYSGTGMGLAITKKIIENMGGGIWVESEEGKGSTFYFTWFKNNAENISDTG